MTIRLNRRGVLGGALGTLAALPACRSSDKGFDAEVIILGAGLSGLHAARLLEGEGKDILVLEGSDRIGGRMHTLGHGALGYTEAGGEQVGACIFVAIQDRDTAAHEMRPAAGIAMAEWCGFGTVFKANLRIACGQRLQVHGEYSGNREEFNQE